MIKIFKICIILFFIEKSDFELKIFIFFFLNNVKKIKIKKQIMEKININLFNNLFSFINEIEQVGNNKEKIKEIKNKKIQEIKKPFNQLFKNFLLFFH